MKNGSMPAELHVRLQKDIAPSLRWSPDRWSSLDAWQREASAKLSELLGMDKFEPAEDDIDIEYVKERDGYTETRFTFQTEPGYRALCLLLVPADVRLPAPVCICVDGHSRGMHRTLGRTLFEGEEPETRERRFRPLHAVKNGYCALCIEQRGFGERGGNAHGAGCYDIASTALLIGRTLIGERVWDISRGVDLLEKRFGDTCDPSCVALMGESGGGTATFYASCLEKRIKAVNSTIAVCSYGESIMPIHHCICNYIPHIAEYFDMGDLGGLIAPRIFIMDNGEKDEIFRIAGAVESYGRIRGMYALAGAEENCRMIIGDCGHEFSWDKVWPLFNELTGWSK